MGLLGLLASGVLLVPLRHSSDGSSPSLKRSLAVPVPPPTSQSPPFLSQDWLPRASPERSLPPLLAGPPLTCTAPVRAGLPSLSPQGPYSVLLGSNCSFPFRVFLQLGGLYFLPTMSISVTSMDAFAFFSQSRPISLSPYTKF